MIGWQVGRAVAIAMAAGWLIRAAALKGLAVGALVPDSIFNGGG